MLEHNATVIQGPLLLYNCLVRELLTILRERRKQNKQYLDHRTKATCKRPSSLMNGANKIKDSISKVYNLI